MGEEDLYREVILDHFKNPRNKGVVAEPEIKASGANPFCGDEIEVSLKVQDGRVQALKINPQGCAISQASASMMAEVLEGRDLSQIKSDVELFRAKMVRDGAGPWPDHWEDLESLEGVKKYPVRVKCALLAWNTLAQGIKEFEARGSAEKVAARHVEEGS